MLEVFNPYTQNKIASLQVEGELHLKQKLTKAKELFDQPARHLPKAGRIRILDNLIELMRAQAEELAQLAASEGGKPLIDSRVEVDRAIQGVILAKEEIGRMAGQQIPTGHTASSVDRLAFSTWEPIGVVAAISAFNHPLNLIVHQVITAFAAGCPVIVKPALTTPLSCLRLLGLLYEAGCPKEWCQSLICEDDVAEKLATDPAVAYLTFIGSAKVGWYLRSRLAPGTRCALEHGGVAPVIIEKDADRKKITAPIIKGGFYHAGQVCVSVQKVYVHESIAHEVIEELKTSAMALQTGDQMKETTDVGPLILPKEVERVHNWVQDAISSGAQLICGGNPIGETCYEPTILLNPTESSLVSQNEIFGPVICIYTFSDRSEAIKRANQLRYHFQASVFTQDIDVALKTVKELNAACVMVNDHTAFRVDWMPFGGRDESGLGIGGIEQSMHEMSRHKLMVIKS